MNWWLFVGIFLWPRGEVDEDMEWLGLTLKAASALFLVIGLQKLLA